MKLLLLFFALCLLAGCSTYNLPPASGHLPEGFVPAGINDRGIEEFLHEPTGMIFVLVPAGVFRMGSSDGECEESELPVHEVKIDAFLISKYEVSQGTWMKIMGSNPSFFKTGDNHPVEQVSWNDCTEFCKKTGLRLPAEAEWEYARRGGTTTDLGWKNGYGNDHAVYGQTWAIGHKESGSRMPNGFGLYDMAGNVWEWCNDYYEARYYSRSPEVNPTGPAEGEKRTLRGGSWWYLEYYLRSSYRAGYFPDCLNDDTGFRCACSLTR